MLTGTRSSERGGVVLSGSRIWNHEQALGERGLGAPSPRPANIVQLADVVESDEDGAVAELARSAGAVRTGLNWVRLPPRGRGAPPHCHSAEEEILVVLDLAYGTREPNEVCYYPRSNKIFWRGVGLIARLEPLDYHDGEPDD